MNEILKLKERRASLLADAKDMLARAKGRPDGEQDLTAEEAAKVDAIYAEFDKAGNRIATLERMGTLERAEEQLREVTRRSDPRPGSLGNDNPRGNVGEAVRTWMLRNHQPPTVDQLENVRRSGFDIGSSQITLRYNPLAGDGAVRRDMITTGATNGQGLVQWKEFFDGFVKYEKFYGAAKSLVTILSTETGVPLPVPTFDDTSNTGRWLGEGTTASATDPTVGSVTLNAYMASSDQIPVSIQLLQDSQASLDMVLPMLLGERIGRLKNAAIIGGSGSSQPYGILTRATASGIVVAGTNASPTYSWDNWLDLKYSVDPAYRNAPVDKRGFLMHDTTLSKLRKLKDTTNRYFADPFQPGPGTIDGDPIRINNAVPSTGVNALVGAYGDYSQYLLREVLEVTIMRLDQIKILDGKIVFVAWARCDGNLLNTSSVKTLANPAS